MLETGYVRELSDFMFGTALLTVFMLKPYYAAWNVQETVPIASFEATQRMRYTILLFAQSVLLFLAIWMLAYGPEAVWVNMNLWTEGTGPFGYLVWAMVAFTLTSPLMTLLTFSHIYRRPSRLAYRVQKGIYYLTADVRAGKLYPVEVVKTVTHGRAAKQYRYIW